MQDGQAVALKNETAVRDGNKRVAIAVAKGDVFKKPLPVEDVVLDGLVVRQDLTFREPESLDEP